MRKPVIRFFENNTVDSNKVIGDSISTKIGDPYSKTTFTKVPQEDYKRFATSVLEFADNVRQSIYKNSNGVAGKAVPALKTAILSSGILEVEDEFIAEQLALVLSWGWGCGGEDPHNQSPDSFRIVKDERDASTLVDKIVSFLIKRGLSVNDVGSSGILVTYLKAILQSVICPKTAEKAAEAPPPEAPPPPAELAPPQ